MTNIDIAIKHLKKYGIESFEKGGILVIPCEGPSELFDTVNKVKRYLKEIEYDKSWEVNPYYVPGNFEVFDER